MWWLKARVGLLFQKYLCVCTPTAIDKSNVLKDPLISTFNRSIQLEKEVKKRVFHKVKSVFAEDISKLVAQEREESAAKTSTYMLAWQR